MLDRTMVAELLNWEFADTEIELTPGIAKDQLIETFALFTEDDLSEWLKDNLKSFFNHGDPDWDWIRGRIAYYKNNP